MWNSMDRFTWILWYEINRFKVIFRKNTKQETSPSMEIKFIPLSSSSPYGREGQYWQVRQFSYFLKKEEHFIQSQLFLWNEKHSFHQIIKTKFRFNEVIPFQLSINLRKKKDFFFTFKFHEVCLNYSHTNKLPNNNKIKITSNKNWWVTFWILLQTLEMVFKEFLSVNSHNVYCALLLLTHNVFD